MNHLPPAYGIDVFQGPSDCVASENVSEVNGLQYPDPIQQHYFRDNVRPLPRQPARVQSLYASATPLELLNMAAQPVDCPRCRARTMTKVEWVAGHETQYYPGHLL
jgi:hypothetical protein